MKAVKIYQINQLSPQQVHRLKAAQVEAAQVWNVCMEAHKAARMAHEQWPGRNELQRVTKGGFALHSQSVQMVVHALSATRMEYAPITTGGITISAWPCGNTGKISII